MKHCIFPLIWNDRFRMSWFYFLNFTLKKQFCISSDNAFFQLMHSQLIIRKVLIFIINENDLLYSSQKLNKQEKVFFLLSCMSNSEEKMLAIQILHQYLFYNKILYSSTEGAHTIPCISLSLQITKFPHSLWTQKLIILYKLDIESWGIVREIMDDVTLGRGSA